MSMKERYLTTSFSFVDLAVYSKAVPFNGLGEVRVQDAGPQRAAASLSASTTARNSDGKGVRLSKGHFATSHRSVAPPDRSAKDDAWDLFHVLLGVSVILGVIFGVHTFGEFVERLHKLNPAEESGFAASILLVVRAMSRWMVMAFGFVAEFGVSIAKVLGR